VPTWTAAAAPRGRHPPPSSCTVGAVHAARAVVRGACLPASRAFRAQLARVHEKSKASGHSPVRGLSASAALHVRARHCPPRRPLRPPSVASQTHGEDVAQVVNERAAPRHHPPRGRHGHPDAQRRAGNALSQRVTRPPPLLLCFWLTPCPPCTARPPRRCCVANVCTFHTPLCPLRAPRLPRRRQSVAPRPWAPRAVALPSPLLPVAPRRGDTKPVRGTPPSPRRDRLQSLLRPFTSEADAQSFLNASGAYGAPWAWLARSLTTRQ
jgi:hypothetical protein